MNLNVGWHFSQVGLNSQVGSQVAPFRNLLRNLICRLRNLKLNLRNGTSVPGGSYAGYENFHKLNSGLANLSFEDFASWTLFSQVEILLCFLGLFSFFGFLRLSSNSFEVPHNFDHPKNLS